MDLEKISVEIIANSGEAKSILFEAIDMAQQNNLSEATKLVNQAKEKITSMLKKSIWKFCNKKQMAKILN